MSEKVNIFVAPSIFAGDFSILGKEARRIEESGADAIHIDIMDGHFVPNLTLGPKAVAAINKSTDLFLDVHMMTYNSFELIESFVKAGADRISIHFESTEDIEEILHYIRRCDVEVGLAFSPETSYEFIPKFLPMCDYVLIMTVYPGFCGQKFLSETVNKISYVRNYCNTFKMERLNRKTGKTEPFLIGVDGGIDNETAQTCVKAGATFLVSGSYLFNDQGGCMKDKVHFLQSIGE